MGGRDRKKFFSEILNADLHSYCAATEICSRPSVISHMCLGMSGWGDGGECKYVTLALCL